MLDALANVRFWGQSGQLPTLLTDLDDPAALVDHERNAADIGVCALETDAQQSDQRDQSASKQDQNSHGCIPGVRPGRDLTPLLAITVWLN